MCYSACNLIQEPSIQDCATAGLCISLCNLYYFYYDIREYWAMFNFGEYAEICHLPLTSLCV